MAGGSADAAAALVACDQLWGLGTPRVELEHVAAEVGSDVPFLLTGGTAMASGRGEVLAPVLARGTYHWVLAVSEGGLSTPAVYAECDRLRGDRPVPEPTPTPEMMTALRSGDPRALGAALANDLQAAAISLMPALADVIDAGLEFGAIGGIVSGSGPTVAFLAEDNESALDLAVSLTASGTVQDVRRATGPAHGAHVVSGVRAR
jgi:4-diphosphocytidyl-2-C-methyl-D-erythritol kinase